MGIEGIDALTSDNTPPQIGDIQKEKNIEWVIVGVHNSRISRVKRNSLAHQVHAEGSPEIAKSLTIK